jgi:hypothetical protein
MSRARPRRLVTAALATLALAGAGCGSADLSGNQLRDGAARACNAAAVRAGRIATPPVPAAGVEFLQRGVAAFTPELTQLRRLRAPAGAGQAYADALSALQRKLGLMEAAVRVLGQGADPVQTVQALQRRLAPVESREDAAWHALDVPACLNR